MILGFGLMIKNMFNRKPKEYKCTSKIKFAFQKAKAFEMLANEYIRQDKHERAKQAMFDHKIAADKAWELVGEIYPQLQGKTLRHLSYGNKVIVVED